MRAEVDELRCACNAREQRLDELTVVGDDREHGAVMVGIRVDVEDAPVLRRTRAAIAAMTTGSRPSETFGTDSSRATDLLYGERSCFRRRDASPDPTRRYPSIASLQRDLAALPALRRRRASRSSPRPSSRAQRAVGPTCTARRPASSRERRARPGVAAPAGRCVAGSSSTKRAFDATFYCASVTRCYPGRAAGRGDRTPTPIERRLCDIVAHRGAAPPSPCARGHRRRPRRTGHHRRATLAECVGKSYLIDDAVVIPLPHPSGASAWLNDSVNRGRLGKALTHARREIARLDDPG